jgi:hypothetical protein
MVFRVARSEESNAKTYRDPRSRAAPGDDSWLAVALLGSRTALNEHRGAS